MTTKEIIKKLAYWTVPPGIYDFLATIRARNRHLPLEVQEILEGNYKFKDSYRGRRCFILATGPSIRQQNLKLLKGEICISVSNFFVHPDFQRIRPRFHCITPLHPPFTDEDGIRWFREMESQMENTVLFLSYSDKHLINKNGLFAGRRVHYLYFGDNWSRLINNDFDLTRPLPYCQSVSVMALMVALYIGCREIYLLGNDLTVFNPNSGKYDYGHFYDGQSQNACGEMPVPADLENDFFCLAKLWQQYKIIREFARAKNIAIYNATAGGILDLFPRVNYESLFK